MKDEPDTCQFKYDFDDAFQSIKMFGTKRGRMLHKDTAALPHKYPSKIPISAAKKRDLIQICKSGIIPSEYLEYYKSLPAHQSVCDRLPEPDVLEGDASDTDIE